MDSPSKQQIEQPQTDDQKAAKGRARRFLDWLLCNYDLSLEYPKFNDGRDMPSLGLGVDLMKENLSQQMAQADAVDAKAGFILGSASLLTGVLVAWRKPPSTALGLVHALPVIALVVYALVVVFSAWAYATRSYRHSPHPIKMRDDYVFLEVPQAEDKIFHGMVLSWLRNDRTINRKIRLTWIAFGVFCIQAAVVGVIILAELAVA